jgi:hypothetical protein
VSVTSNDDAHESVVLWKRFLDTPTEVVSYVVTVSHYILTKFFYFGAVLGGEFQF